MTSDQLSELPERFFTGQDRLKGLLPPELVAPGYQAELVGFPLRLHGMFDGLGLMQQLGVLPPS